jgi:hypothetical protein
MKGGAILTELLQPQYLHILWTGAFLDLSRSICIIILQTRQDLTWVVRRAALVSLGSCVLEVKPAEMGHRLG